MSGRALDHVTLVGQTLGHYRMTEKIGAGGMGVVYLAHDERLDREVAVKVLPPGTLIDESARKRFRKEARSLSKANHPNIATIYDFDSQGDVDYLVMEYVPGKALRDRISEGPLPQAETIRLATQLAKGLTAAHEQGLVHRDLKPENVRLTLDGRLKILDFGLAKLIRPLTDLCTTDSNISVLAGTPPYMAPEQLLGSVVDQSTDVFSFGVVLYEIATGQRPFVEVEPSHLVAAILHRPPEPPRKLNPKVSPDLERIILKCLEKQRKNRYQSARELLVDLRRVKPSSSAAAITLPARHRNKNAWLAAGALVVLAIAVALMVQGWVRRTKAPTKSGMQIESLAVLPLANLARDHEQDYFADGMTEELITNLAKIGALRVISRTSAMQYKQTQKPLPQIAKELKVDGIVEGSVLRAGKRVRITAQLIHGPTDTHLWAQSYERDLRDVLQLQSEVAQAIAQEIRIKLTPKEQALVRDARPINAEAYAAYLQGQFYLNRRTVSDMKKAIQYFEESARQDPHYAMAYVGLANVYNVISGYDGMAPKEALPQAKAAALKALEIDDALAAAHAALAYNKSVYEGDWVGAESEFRRALELNPGDANTRHWYSQAVLTPLGRRDEAIAQLRQSLDLDPLSLVCNANLGWTYYFARQFDKAMEQYQNTLAMDPSFAKIHFHLAEFYEQAGKFPEAIAENEKLSVLSGTDPQRAERRSEQLRSAYERLGERGYWQKQLQLTREDASRSYVRPTQFARIHAKLGERDEAFRWLQRAWQEHDEWIRFIKVDPGLDFLRSDPRLHDLMRRMNFPQ